MANLFDASVNQNSIGENQIPTVAEWQPAG
jgi:hypothetical protein